VRKERETDLRGEPLPGMEEEPMNDKKFSRDWSSYFYRPRSPCPSGSTWERPHRHRTGADRKAKAAKVCVMPTEYMKAEHMQLLDVWRDTVVRNAERIYRQPRRQAFNMSLSNTCLDCHSNKAEFCDRCHTVCVRKILLLGLPHR
jgi:hypothetical protein